jgi:hypothetical protein
MPRHILHPCPKYLYPDIFWKWEIAFQSSRGKKNQRKNVYNKKVMNFLSFNFKLAIAVPI